jgi:hypothetical protein
MAAHALVPKKLHARLRDRAVDAAVWVWEKHPRVVVVVASLFGSGAVTAVVLYGLSLGEQHLYVEQMGLWVGSVIVAALVAAWIYADVDADPVTHWDGHQWDDAGRLPSVEPVEPETEVSPTVKVAA